jgi:7,8-dihydropterin-6-yl-methyl-4-(beta-D-ribofuranosyl)aminobenzene 5'-phosphate synthase
MHITALIENTKAPGTDLFTEPGLALHIEKNGTQILFDSGMTPKMLANAEKLKINLEKIDICVISHGHFDHTGGLAEFLTRNKKAKVYMRRGADGTFIFLMGPLKKKVGVPTEIFTGFKDRIIFIDEYTQPIPGVHLITSIHRTRPLAKGNLKLKQVTPQGVIQDEFTHELVMTLTEGNNSAVVITGCSHNGLCNMIDAVKTQLPQISIGTVLGGFHLMGIPLLKNSMASTPEEVTAIAHELLSYQLEKVYTMHCTGMKAYDILKSEMGDKIEYLSTGMCLDC